LPNREGLGFAQCKTAVSAQAASLPPAGGSYMSILLLDSSPAGMPIALGAVGSQQERIRREVHAALLLYHPAASYIERRRETRFAYPYPFHLTPLSVGGAILLEAMVAVIGRHLSEGGLDFYHREPFPYRRAIATLPAAGNRPRGLRTNALRAPNPEQIPILIERARIAAKGGRDVGLSPSDQRLVLGASCLAPGFHLLLHRFLSFAKVRRRTRRYKSI
jgi:hypothetical protein